MSRGVSRWISASGPALFGLSLVLISPPSTAAVDLERVIVVASTRYVAGTDAANPSFTAPTRTDSLSFDIEPELPQPRADAAAESVAVVPSFTSPFGANGDTLFKPAVMRAYQTVAGFNAASVEAAIADGKPFHRAEARTEWVIEVLASRELPDIPTSLSLDYLLFPGAAGLTTFGGFVGEAGFRAAISVDDVIIAESVSILRSGGGTSPPVFTASGDFSQPSVALAAETYNGLPHNIIRTEPVFGGADLGVIPEGEGKLLKVRYVLEAWLELPGFEVGGFAHIGDPFALSSDPSGYLASQFPGLDVQPFTLREVAPVPLPGGLALMLGALGLTGATLRRTRGCPRFTA